MFEVGSSVFGNFKPLLPAEAMPRNETCWCRSGRKWKKCHAIREHQKRLPNSALHAKFYEIGRQTSTCLHPDAPSSCAGGIIRAHTVQRRSGLEAIAENGHVLSARNNHPSDTKRGLQSIGVNDASTFRGFCSHHDGLTFRVADLAQKPTKEAAFLLSYRALCYEIWMKKVAVPVMKYFRDHLDAGMSFQSQVAIQTTLAAMLHTSELGYFEHARLKEEWDRVLVSGDLSGFQWSYTRFNGILPVVTSGSFFPERDFSGSALQGLNAPIGHLALLGFNVLPIGGNTCVIFGWIDGKSQNRRFVESFERIPRDVLASGVIQFCFDTSDNVFVKPSWWIDLPDPPKKYLIWNLRESTPGEKQPDGLVPRYPPLIEMAVSETGGELA